MARVQTKASRFSSLVSLLPTQNHIFDIWPRNCPKLRTLKWSRRNAKSPPCMQKRNQTDRLAVAMYCTKSRNERLSIFIFYDLQIWNVSPPSCLRLDHAQRVRRTFQHSCPDTTLAYTSGFELENNTVSLRLKVEISLKR